jgi:hypothetical protein
MVYSDEFHKIIDNELNALVQKVLKDLEIKRDNMKSEYEKEVIFQDIQKTLQQKLDEYTIKYVNNNDADDFFVNVDAYLEPISDFLFKKDQEGGRRKRSRKQKGRKSKKTTKKSKRKGKKGSRRR